MNYLDTKTRGKFIVIYGANNIGKSTQVGKIASRMASEYHEQLLLIKYPIYGLKPTGPQIKRVIKGSVKNVSDMPGIELQKLYAQNRRDFQDIIESCLMSGIHVIAEDYIGTGIAWGMTNGVSLKDLLEINNYLLLPDLSILLDGKRFKSGIEKQHIFENAGNDIWQKNREIHLQLAKKYKWKVIKSDDPEEIVHNNIWTLLINLLGIKS